MKITTLIRIAVGDDEASETGGRRELAHARRPVGVAEQQQHAAQAGPGKALQQALEHER